MLPWALAAAVATAAPGDEVDYFELAEDVPEEAHSSFSAGPGGPHLVVLQGVAGLLAGAIWAAGDPELALPLLAGGAALGMGTAALLQHQLSLSVPAAYLSPWMSLCGAALGGAFAILSGERNGSVIGGLVTAFALGAPLAAAAMPGSDALTGSDVAMVMFGTALVELLVLDLLLLLLPRPSNSLLPATALSLAPAVAAFTFRAAAAQTMWPFRRIGGVLGLPIVFGLVATLAVAPLSPEAGGAAGLAAALAAATVGYLVSSPGADDYARDP